MEAFRLAVETWGVDMLETDARLTSDGKVVLIHDDTVDRTCDGTGAVAGMTWRQLGELDAGYHFRDLSGETSFCGRAVRVPTLDEVLESFPEMRVNVETKCAEVAGPLVEVIRRHGAEHRVMVAAKFEPMRRAARGYTGPWGASRRQIGLFWCASRSRAVSLFRPRFDLLQVPETWHGVRVVTRRFVADAHRLNVPVQVWVVDEEADMRRLLEWGVDGLQSDRLDRLARVLTEVVGRPPPPGASP
ncbi:MAG: glycerophosphodiester phosphodiesterase [Planctomycetes bacterium]|nr:glycerophosphodiester phosphodiesterase [Planctomycetota bacterium]